MLPRLSTVTVRGVNIGDEYMGRRGFPRTCTEVTQHLVRKAWKGGIRVEP